MADEIDRMAHEGDAGQLAAMLAPETTAAEAESTLPAQHLPASADTPSCGQSIGRYKLLQEIGEGGFGTVFMAEQQTPVIRRVALKVIKVGMDTKLVIARFDAERQALAMMDHPNIAKVFDAGQTEAGRPYFVMELIRGIPITEYCDQNDLGVRDRLSLFVNVCQAVQHAHTKGIIHRDIKPSNVLVTMHDAVAVPKVIDFGVAKAIDRRLTEKTLFTAYHQMVGTPEYMSPEQAEMSGIDIDTRSDVYSLGVLLYELLTGTTPFDTKELRAKGYAEIQRIVREVEPPTPSTRLSSLGQTLGAVARHRHSDPGRLCQSLRGELDWVVMKCLEKDRTRRYETANALARDIQRHLQHETVEASPPSARYKLHKFARRYRAPLLIVGGFSLVLLLATAVSTWQAVRATQAKNAEVRQRTLAEQATAIEVAQRKQAESAAKLIECFFRGLDPHGESTGDVTNLRARLVAQLDLAAANLNKGYADEPAVRARLRTALAKTQLGLGEAGRAVPLFEAVFDEERLYAGPDQPQTLAALENLGRAYTVAGQPTKAIKALEQVRAQLIRKLGADHPDTLRALEDLADAYMAAFREDEAIQAREQVTQTRLRARRSYRSNTRGSNSKITISS